MHTTLNRYLLGDLPEAEAVKIDQLLLVDDDFYQELLIAEDELIDSYLAGGLSESERRSFESRFLVGNERQRKFQFGKLFRTYVNTQESAGAVSPVQTAHSTRAGLFSRLVWPKPVWAAALVILVVLGGVITIWTVRHQRQGSVATTSATLTLVLTPGANRSNGNIQRISQPAPTTGVQLQLQLVRGDNNKFKAELCSEAGVLLTFNNLTPETRDSIQVVTINVGGQLLTVGDYWVKLSAVTDSGEAQAPLTYPFRVINQ